MGKFDKEPPITEEPVVLQEIIPEKPKYKISLVVGSRYLFSKDKKVYAKGQAFITDDETIIGKCKSDAHFEVKKV